jgi:hypothetical protein
MTISDEELAALFKPAPLSKKHRGAPLDPKESLLDLARRGFSRMRFRHTAQLAREYGVETTKMPEKLRLVLNQSAQKGVTYEGALCAKTWFVLLCECEPCNPAAKEQALERIKAGDTELRQALEALASLSSKQAAFATFVMEQWTP